MLRSHPSNVFVLKYYAPVILFGGTLVFWSVGFRWAQLIILVPLIFGMLFYASLAVLQIPDGNIRYRRLFKWRKISFEEIVSCGASFWLPGPIGYIRLSRFVLPWGRLLFVLDANEKIFGRGDYPLPRFIQRHMKSKTN